MARLVLSVTMILWAAALSAQAPAVVVKSGEHPGFARLVFEYGGRAGWVFGRTADGYALRIARAEVRYDLTEVFRRIARDRLTAIWADPLNGDLRLGVGCACHAVAFEFRPGIVVVDIRDGPAAGGSGFERGLDAPDGPALAPLAARPLRRPMPRPPTLSARPAAPAPADRPAKARPGPVYDWLALRRAGSQPPPAEPPPPYLRKPDPQVAAAQGALLDRIGRAAAQGILDPVARLPARAPKPLPAAPPQGFPVPIPAVGGHHLHIHDGTGAVEALTAEGAVCLPDSELALAEWGGDLPFAARLAELRAALVGEFDRPDPTVALALARLYLHAGFGVEATEVLAVFGGGKPAAVVATLAAVMDGRPLPETHALAGMEACDGPAALWAVLTRPALRPGDVVNRKAVLRGFSALPLHLRRHLAPDLSQRFLDTGDEPTAQAIRDAVDRAPGDHGSGLRLTEARIAMSSGQTARAEEALRALIAANDPTSADALIALTDSILARGGVLDPPMLITLTALERQHRGGAAEAALRRALALATAAEGDYDTGFALVADTPEVTPELWRMLAARGGDDAVLRHALTGAAPPQEAAPDPVRRALAARLLDLGFAEAAEAWIPASGAEDEHLLAARAALLRRDGRAALRALAGLGDSEAAALRARAHGLLGRHDAAARAWAAAGEPAQAGRAAWRGGDWQAPDPEADGLRLALERLRPADEAAADTASVAAAEPAGPLARGRSLLEDSRSTRGAVADLLGGFPPPANAAP